MVGFFFAFGSEAHAATYTVTSTNDSGTGSFRQAIINSNANAGADQIDFNIAGAGPHTISIASSMTYINDEVVINGMSQPGSVCNGPDTELMIRLDLSNVSNAFYISDTAQNTELNGLAIANAAENAYGLFVTGDDVTLRCNFFGTFDGATVASAQTNSDYVLIGGDNVMVGGPAVTDMNLSLANAASNHKFKFDGADNFTFQNNIAGVTVDGTTAVTSNASALVVNSVTSGTIANNLLYSSGWAVYISGTTVSNLDILNNKIGVDSTGNTAFPDSTIGISTFSPGSNWLVEGNTIAATKLNGTAIAVYSEVDDVTLRGNNINVSSDGSSAFGAPLDGNNTVYIGPQGADNWLIEDNLLYGNQLSARFDSVTDFVMRNNIVGMNSTKTNCFDGARAVQVLDSTNFVFGGTDSSDANTVCVEDTGLRIVGSTDGFSALGNSIVTDSIGWAIDTNYPGALTKPVITAISESVGLTTINYKTDLPAGDYSIEIFDNDNLAPTPNYQDAQNFIAVDNITSSGSEESFSLAVSGDTYENLSITATLKDGSVDGFGNTSKVGAMALEASVSETTSTSTETVQEGMTDYEVQRTITNFGPSTIATIDFGNAATFDCFNITSVNTNGTATNTGAYDLGLLNWAGLLEEGQSLEITFVGDVTCNAGDSVDVVLQTEGRFDALGNILLDNDTSDNSEGDYVSITGQEADLDIQTTDGVEEVVSGTTNHQITQTITNNGPSTITDIEFTMQNSDCFPFFDIGSVTESGTATDTGSYTNHAWSGALGSDQTLILTFTSDLDPSCVDGTLYFDYQISSLQSNGQTVTDITNDNNDYYDTTTIVVPASDTTVSQVLTNPQDIAVGQTLEYDLTFTNQGPEPIDISQFDGSMGDFGPLSLLIYFIPPELNYIGYVSDDGDIACSSFGPGSGSLYGPTLANHSDWELVMCYEATGSENILNQDESRVVTLQVEPGMSSDLDFTNYVFSAFGQNDPDLQVLAGLGSDDLIDYLSYNPIDNFAASLPVSDLSITKELVTPFNATPGETVSYDITLSNNGPMGLDLALADDSLFSDVYPGADLTYVDTSTADVSCLDLGPGSSAYIGPAGQDHPDHQLLACGYNGASQTLAPGEDFTVRLNFMVTNSVSSSFTNYAIHAALPTDLDVLYLSNLFVNATEDILDTTTNENFAKVTYTNPDSIDTDDDGITDSTEDASPNGGDANNDGTPDSEQTNVTSYISTVTSEPVVLEVDDTCSIATTEVNAEATGDAEDNQYQYPLGFIGFSLECGDPGHTATITQYYYNETNQSYILRKYNFNTDTYRTLEDASISNQTIASIPVIRATYQVADGSSLDLDGSTDGNITDPAGLAVKPPNGVLSSTGESLVKVFVMAGVLIIFGSTIVVTTLRCRNKVV